MWELNKVSQEGKVMYWATQFYILDVKDPHITVKIRVRGMYLKLPKSVSYGGTWKLFVIDGNHNHSFPTYNVGRSIISRLSEDEKIKAKEMTRAHVPPSQILISIKKENKDNLTTVKQMYNYRQTI
ncbi:hypothetical protein POM88_020118 [Heracleum sosnowskyi]|uniref:Protein FAR1-RELATED SEQUENCE n=1 Tax=Heracleum sosnowskyi TaxID=360622 RepID=A0AAD8MSI2_9APIA|nr:hypothetical protein POM88_020118 [Heracleum sosnowskyi]